MWEHIRHEEFKDHDIRSSPRKDPAKEHWKIRIDITFPPIHGTTSMTEYLDDNHIYMTLSEAHTAGFEYGRRIIDEKLRGTFSNASSHRG